MGFAAVLHTWHRQFQGHPHVHCIVPGGGLGAGGQWIAARQRDWLLPVAKLAAVFRRRMEAALSASAPALHAAMPAGTWRRLWVVQCQPAGNGASVVRYLARYFNRTAKPAEPKWHLRCPHCERFTLVIIGTLSRPARAPPICTQ